MLWTLRVTDTTMATSVCSQALTRCRGGFADCFCRFSSLFSNLLAQLLSFLLSTCQKTVIRFHIFNDWYCYFQLQVHVGPNFCTVITKNNIRRYSRYHKRIVSQHTNYAGQTYGSAVWWVIVSNHVSNLGFQESSMKKKYYTSKVVTLTQ